MPGETAAQVQLKDMIGLKSEKQNWGKVHWMIHGREKANVYNNEGFCKGLIIIGVELLLSMLDIL